MIRNMDQAIDEIRKYLPDYLQKHGMDTSKRFSCPNKHAHKNGDSNPSCALVPKCGGTVWHCFAENMTGDIFSACHYLENRDTTGAGFVDTMKYLADMFNIKLDTDALTDDERETKLYYKMYNASLQTLPVCNDQQSVDTFLEARGWPQDKSLATYCVRDYKTYRKHLVRNFPEETLKKIGLLDKSLFAPNRVLFPIYNHSRHIVAYAGRLIGGGSVNKYYNTITYKNYNKGSLLYNFCNCTNKLLYITEGYADCISMVLNGYPNTVAVGSTALSRNHIKSIINRGITSLCLCFDNDEHGKKATERALDMLSGYDLICFVAKLPDDIKDPDEFFRKEPRGKIDKLSEFEFNVMTHLETDTPENVVSRVVPQLADESNIVLRNKYIIFLSNITGIEANDIKETVENHNQPKKKQTVTSIKKNIKKLLSKHTRLDYLVPALSEEMKQIENTTRINDNIDYFEKWKQDIIIYNQEAEQNKEILGHSVGFDQLTKNLDGWQRGCWYCFGGYSNILKTGFLIELALRAVTYNDVSVIFLSLDDSKKMIIPRMLANLANIPINLTRKPNTLSEDDRGRYDRALAKLQTNADRLLILDSSDVKSLSQVEDIILAIKKYSSRDVILFWDSHHTVIEGAVGENMRTKHVALANKVKDLTVENNIVTISTIELTKGSDRRLRPSINDIRETVDIEYRASVIGLMYNDFHSRGRQNATVYWTDGYGARREVIEINIVKNKTSFFKGVIPFKAIKERNIFEEWESEDMSTFYEMVNDGEKQARRWA